MGKPQNEKQDLDEAKNALRHADSNDPSHHAPGGGITKPEDAEEEDRVPPRGKGRTAHQP
jgi:hypothetical protein